MLEPRARRLLLDALRPPDGYALDHTVGTTYSLDLLALLVAPLAFSLFEADESDDTSRIDPLALLAAVRRHAGRITLFCEAGRIAVPARHQPLFGYLEETVFEATAPAPGHAFHPKVWVLRFVAEGEPIKYRVLCLSRNLTFDRSWDTALVLDGEVQEQRTNAFALNRPLSEFVAALPALLSVPLPESRANAVATIADELLRVKFEAPDGTELIRFWPLGIEGHMLWPFEGRIDRLLVVSPFLSAGCLHRLTADRDGCVLVSRPDTLPALSPSALSGFARVFQLSPFAEPEEEPGNALSGLHAKAYVADAGRDARIWTGSANATEAAFNGNVEFLVELSAKKSACGIDVVLREGTTGESFRALLEEFTRGNVNQPNAAQLRLEAVLDDARRAVAGAGLRAVLKSRDEPGVFALELIPRERAGVALPAGVTATCWPVSISEAAAGAVAPNQSPAAVFARLTTQAITRFFAFALVAADGGCIVATRFVLNVPLDGAPADRTDQLLFQILRDRRTVMRLIRLLLADGGADVAALLGGWAADEQSEGQNRGTRGFEVPLFETLVRALDRNPAKLDEVSGLVNELVRTPEGRDLLPEGFHSIWEPIWAARQELRR